MSKHREFWIDIVGQARLSKEDNWLGSQLHVIDKAVADKLADALDQIRRTDRSYCDIIAAKALKEYRGE